MAGLNAIAVIRELEDELRSSSDLRRLSSIPEIVRPMAARIGLLLAWIDIAVRRKTQNDIEDYQSEYLEMINNNIGFGVGDILTGVGLFPHPVVSAIAAGVSLLHSFAFGNSNPKDKSLDIYRSSVKLQNYFRKLHSTIFDKTLDGIIYGEEGLFLGNEFKSLKQGYSDGVIGARQNEIDRFAN